MSGPAVHVAPEALGDLLGDADRVLVVGGAEAVFAAAGAVGMSGRVTGVGLRGADREAAERRRRLEGHYQVAFADGGAGSLPVGDAGLDAVVLAPPAARSRPRGAVLREVARALRPGGRLIVVGAAP